ncbi:MAG: hypothetical protein M3143_01730 [Actinomycetota bacterium]|nr:hypothetical protein [Actinomycetota bacterium]
MSRTDAAGPTKEVTMLAIVAAILFALALVLHIAGVALGPIDATAFMLAGLLCLALQLAGVGAGTRSRSRL